MNIALAVQEVLSNPQIVENPSLESAKRKPIHVRGTRIRRWTLAAGILAAVHASWSFSPHRAEANDDQEATSIQIKSIANMEPFTHSEVENPGEPPGPFGTSRILDLPYGQISEVGI